MDGNSYINKQDKQFLEYEGRCRNCGECCGAYSTDPCANLIKRREGQYYCTVYENRLGPQKTVSGNVFNCVVIRDVIKFGVSYRNCAYMNQL